MSEIIDAGGGTMVEVANARPTAGSNGTSKAKKPAAKKAAAKPAAKPAANKPAAKPAAKAAAAEAKARPDRHMSETPAAERKVALVKALRKFRATSSSAACPLAKLVEELGYTRFDVYGLINGTSGAAGSAPTCLAATGHVKVIASDEGLAAYLTPKGKDSKFTEPPFARAAK